MHKDCFNCDIKQMLKISVFLSLEKDVEEMLIKKTNTYLKHCDMTKSNPEIMADIWQIVGKVLNNVNPYQEIKSYYNQFLLSLIPDFKVYINNDLYTALKMTIAANLIDFSSKDKISKEQIENLLLNAKDLNLIIDDSKDLFNTLNKSHNLLYLGDNCGEIVLDKLFISMIKEKYPQLEVYYGVRGKPIVNDVTLEDALEVKMQEVAHIISNGDGSLGTVLAKTSNEFKKLFNEVDAVICKGQGNYEGLIDCQKSNLYFLFMSKCKLIANMTHTNISDIICMKKTEL